MPKIVKPEWRELTEDELNARLDAHFQSVTATAYAICDHVKIGSKDEEGHALHPCQRCVKIVRHVLETWAVILKARSTTVAQREMQTDMLIMVQLHHAYDLAASVLDPDESKALEGFGVV